MIERMPVLNRFILLILFAAIIYVTRCERRYHSVIKSGEKTSTLILEDTLNVRYRQTLFNYDENIWITFDSLIADSRCPIGVMCFWEGNAEVSFIFDSIRFNLNTYKGFTYDTVVSDYRIGLINVWPYPHADSLYTEDQYSIDIVVSREAL